MKVLLIVVLYLARISHGQAAAMCYEKGECTGGNVIGVVPGESDYNACLEICQANNNCKYFTYNHDVLTCFSFDSCPTISTDSCIDCHSGERACNYYRQCDAPGECNGGYLHSEARESEYHCIAMCHDIGGCLYYTYYADTSTCIAYSSCAGYSTGCSNCVSGEVTCGNINPGSNLRSSFFLT